MLKQIADDIVKVQRHARFVWEIYSNGSVSQAENPKGALSVIAIIGPGERSLDSRVGRTNEALLCEIGFWRSRPYRRSNAGPNTRHKLFRLSEAQYRIVAPLVWSKLNELAEKTVSGWKNRTFGITVNKHYYRRTRQELQTKDVRQDFPRGARFCFDLRDEEFVRDACWVELNRNKQLQGQMNDLAWYIDMCLSTYPQDGRSLERFSRLKRAQPVLARLADSGMPLHVVVETLLRLPGGTKYPHMEHLAKIVGWDHLPTLAHRRAAKALELGSVEKRVKDLQLRVNHEKNGHLVVEIYPPLPAKPVVVVPTESLPPVPEDEGNDEEEDYFY